MSAQWLTAAILIAVLTPAGRTFGRAGDGLRPCPRNARRRSLTSTAAVVGDRMRGVFTMMYWGTGMSGWGYVLMTVSLLLFWGLLIAGVVSLARYVSAESRQLPLPMAGSDLRAVLAERFARGEIGEDEYRQRLKVLSGT